MSRKSVRNWIIGAVSAATLAGSGVIMVATTAQAAQEESRDLVVTEVHGADVPDPSQVEESTSLPDGTPASSAPDGTAAGDLTTTLTAVEDASIPDPSDLEASIPVPVGTVPVPLPEGTTTAPRP